MQNDYSCEIFGKWLWLGSPEKPSFLRAIQSRVICQLTLLALFIRYKYATLFEYRTLRLYEIGLISLWKNWFEPNTRPCLNDQGNTGNVRNEKKKLAPLSLANLTGAFAVLAIGCLVSLVAFLVEMIVFYCKTNTIVVM